MPRCCWVVLALLFCDWCGACVTDTREEHGRRVAEPGLNKLSSLEDSFVQQMSREKAKENLRFLTKYPHMAGTEQDKVLAEWMVERFKEHGADEAWVEPVKALLSSPKETPRLALLANDSTTVVFQAKLSEDLDDDTSDTPYRNRTFNGYSPSGSVTGEYVYVNYGRKEDFDYVTRTLGISLHNRLVIVRYGKSFRGLKAMLAQQNGAIGVIIYSDPYDDGYRMGDTYPHGPWRSASSVQRGSVQFNSLCAGDPLRAASDMDSFERCGYESNQLYPSIPVLPISWEDALPLLRAIGNGPTPKQDFVGSLPIPYLVGPSLLKLSLTTKNEFYIRPVWNAFALFKGPDFGTDKDRSIILGNHRDAWVFGAADPNSGTSCLLEVSKGLGFLKTNVGWRPGRTILLASWSAEEYGLVGSTAFAETHPEIVNTAIAYLNVVSACLSV